MNLLTLCGTELLPWDTRNAYYSSGWQAVFIKRAAVIGGDNALPKLIFSLEFRLSKTNVSIDHCGQHHHSNLTEE